MRTSNHKKLIGVKYLLTHGRHIKKEIRSFGFHNLEALSSLRLILFQESEMHKRLGKKGITSHLHCEKGINHSILGRWIFKLGKNEKKKKIEVNITK